jgi:hypothetical protein
MPGLVEESLLSLRARKPLFLAGALGGCTQLVIDLLEQRPRPEMTSAIAQAKVPMYAEVAGLYQKYGVELPSREALAMEVSALGAQGPAAALCNGLDNLENRELFQTRDPIRMAELVLTGLERLRI